MGSGRRTLIADASTGLAETASISLADARDRLRDAYEQAARAAGRMPETPKGPAQFAPAATLPELLAQAKTLGVRQGLETFGEDVTGLRALLLYGVKGVAALRRQGRRRLCSPCRGSRPDA